MIPLTPMALYLAVGLASAGPAAQEDGGKAPAPGTMRSGCTAASCHTGIEPIRARPSGMMQGILFMGEEAGDPEGCVVCHGGNPDAKDKEEAHRGAPPSLAELNGPRGFYPDPGSPWVNRRTCGLCHDALTKAQWRSLMMTEAGKIQGASWSFGALQGYHHEWANYPVSNPEDPAARRGTKAYQTYMDRLREREPQVFPQAMKAVPAAPEDLSVLKLHPEQAAFTYIRSECQRCHLAVRGRAERGDFRGMGCSACHIPYGNEGRYEGKDGSMPGDAPRHPMVHAIQATRDAGVSVHGKHYSGIPVETCTTCHDRGKRIGVTFQGLMESAYASPFAEDGGDPPALHTKHYMAMEEDVHYQRGMLCQDCHTSIDLHGDGFLAGTNLAQVEIECADCHGTPRAFPWELPLGFMDEFADAPASGPPRGTAKELPGALAMGRAYAPEGGYLLTARGNPFPEVVRRGEQVIVHTAAGKDLALTPLKAKERAKDLHTEARVAMEAVNAHMDRMECYACHARWAPQCYGCHLAVDYSKGKRSFDWVAAGHRHGDEAARAADAGEAGYDTFIPGQVRESRSYLRYEDPALGVNGEGRITPVIPGCQPVITVIGLAGERILENRIFRTPPGMEGGGKNGQLCIDTSPVNPHTNGHARTCESCHLSEKALGYGIAGGRVTRVPAEGYVVDLATAEGEVLSEHARMQVAPIPGLEADWSRFVTEDGLRLMTVGHHFTLSRPLNEEERAHTSRQGVCLACHQEIPEASAAVNLLHHTADFMDALPHTAEEHGDLVHKVLLFSAWGQVGGGAAGAFAAAVLLLLYLRRRRKRRSAAGSE